MSDEIWFQKTVNVHNNRGGDKLVRKVIPAGNDLFSLTLLSNSPVKRD